MAEQSIDLNRREVKELWDFMADVKATLVEVRKVMADHETRLRTVEEDMAAHRGRSTLTRWVLPILLSTGAIIVSIIAVLRA